MEEVLPPEAALHRTLAGIPRPTAGGLAVSVDMGGAVPVPQPTSPILRLSYAGSSISSSLPTMRLGDGGR